MLLTQAGRSVLQEMADAGHYGPNGSAAIGSFWESAQIGVIDGAERIGGNEVFSFFVCAADIALFPELESVAIVRVWRDVASQQIRHEMVGAR